MKKIWLNKKQGWIDEIIYNDFKDMPANRLTIRAQKWVKEQRELVEQEKQLQGSIAISLPPIRVNKVRVSVYSDWDVYTSYILKDDLTNIKTAFDLRNKWREVEEHTDEQIAKLQKYMKKHYDRDKNNPEMDNFYFLLGLTDDVPSGIQKSIEQLT